MIHLSILYRSKHRPTDNPPVLGSHSHSFTSMEPISPFDLRKENRDGSGELLPSVLDFEGSPPLNLNGGGTKRGRGGKFMVDVDVGFAERGQRGPSASRHCRGARIVWGR